ncbi:MAG: SRPBCC domain-containing protein [Bacteroidetes bacterium]|nr:SRPBCC domain-containing protein [Bacteroidota bacterium]
MKPQPFIIERTFNAPVADVWKALTQKELMKEWYFDLSAFKPEVGFIFQFKGGPTPEKQYLHLCEIVEVIPEKKLKHSWRYDGFEGNSFVTFELFDKGDRTKLILTHEGLETFPKNNLDFVFTNFVEGWTYLINTSLENFLSTNLIK